MSLFDALDRIASHIPQRFMAPLIPQDQGLHMAWSIQNNITYKFRISSQPGWWWLHPAGLTRSPGKGSSSLAYVEALPEQHEILQYLSVLPLILVIALYPAESWSESTLPLDDVSITVQTTRPWVCIPYNMSDAEQRGWSYGAPKLVHLVSESLDPFDVINAHSLGSPDTGFLLYGGISDRVQLPTSIMFYHYQSGIPPARTEWRIAVDLCRANDQVQAQVRAQEARQAQLATVEGSVEAALDFVDASLVSLDKSPGNTMTVTWEYNGHQHTAHLRDNLSAISAGICMDGTSSSHTLTTLVMAIEEARKQHRFDLDKEAWL